MAKKATFYVVSKQQNTLNVWKELSKSRKLSAALTRAKSAAKKTRANGPTFLVEKCSGKGDLVKCHGVRKVFKDTNGKVVSHTKG